MFFATRTVALTGALAIVGAVTVAQGRPDRPDAPDIRTAATVQRTVPPDLATVTLSFSALGRTPAEAGSNLASRTDSLRRALATLGIPRDSVVNRSRWSWWGGRIEVLPGPTRWLTRTDSGPDGRPLKYMVQDTTYRAHDALEVRIRDLTKVGAVLDTALGRGITSLSDVTFTASDVSAAQDDALRLATIRARRQAEVIAAAGNLQLGRTLSLSTQADNVVQTRPWWGLGLSSSAEGSAGGEGSPTVIVRPSVPVSVTVYGRWELIPNR